MKKVLSLIISAILLVACFASCGGTHASAKALDGYLAPLKSGDFDEAVILSQNPFADESLELLEAMYKNFDYKIGDVTVKDGFADVAVSITMTDIGKVFSDYLAKAMSEGNVTEEMFYDMLLAEDAPIKTFDIKVNMYEMSGEWVLSEGAEELSDALTGGLISSLGGLVTD